MYYQQESALQNIKKELIEITMILMKIKTLSSIEKFFVNFRRADKTRLISIVFNKENESNSQALSVSSLTILFLTLK